MPDDNQSPATLAECYATKWGRMYQGTIEQYLDTYERSQRGKIDLIFTSPPFPLHFKKRYGNLDGAAYVDWLAGLADRLADLLKPTGSLVMEIGNAWLPGRPVMSLLPLQTLMAILEKGRLNLCQQFVCHNPARLPTPAQWVNVERIRVKDSFTHVWWMSRGDRPKANNREVLTPYSDDMRRLLKTQNYNSGIRPSGHRIGEKSFLTDNGGAIPPNVLVMSNTGWNDAYRIYCREMALEMHPAPMPPQLPDFFIKMLTDKRDVVLDPFAGSNTTGATAEQLNRRWIAIEPRLEYIEGSVGRFPSLISEAALL